MTRRDGGGAAAATPSAAAAAFSAAVIGWQRTHGRHALPWQNSRDPYRVWLSEIMLQQTQVATVLGYYERFLARFADVAALAAAPLDDVFSLWSGLGYYSRASNLHRCAQVVVAEHGGHFPRSSQALQRLPGIGRSTAAAIAAFCFGERVAILDGNVRRVLARVLAFDGDLAEAAQQRALWDRAGDLLPEHGIEAYTQGLMDLGATLCTTRAPQCLICPVRPLCTAAAASMQPLLPVRSRKLERGKRQHLWLWLCRGDDQVWLVRRPSAGVWAGLWSLPEFDSADDFQRASAAWPGHGERLPTFTHVLTHLDWTLQPLRWTLPAAGAGDDAAAIDASLLAAWPAGRWFGVEQALAAGLPSPLRKLLAATSRPATT